MKTLKNMFLLEAEQEEHDDSNDAVAVFEMIQKKFPELKQMRSIALISHILIKDANKRQAFYKSYYCDASFRGTVLDNILTIKNIPRNDKNITKLAIINGAKAPLMGYLDTQGIVMCYNGNYDRQTSEFKDINKIKTIVRVSKTLNEFIVLLARNL